MRCLSLLFAAALIANLPAADALQVREPEKTTTLQPRKPERQRWSWNKIPADATPEGELKWRPEPFKFEAGPSVRYIDFDGGKDENSGESKDAAWKHHPWDASATGKSKECKGAHTYVFKRGVNYRGALTETASGTAEQPIRLTSDPAWGDGEAAICGSERITGFKQGAAHNDIPDKSKVWYVDLDFCPRLVWEVAGKEITRLPIARTPNWKVSNPEEIKSEWWQWENREWWKKEKYRTKGKKGQIHLCDDPKNLTRTADYYEGATIWSEYAIVMGTPFASVVEMYDPERKALGFQGPYYGDSQQINSGNRYFLEDKPHYLDEAGEHWFEKKGEGGRLYLRLPGDRDPNQSVVEAAKRVSLIESAGFSHVHITGLSFRFTNAFWDTTAREFVHKDVSGSCIKVLGSGENIRIANCRFEHCNQAILLRAAGDTDTMQKISVCDNEILHTDRTAISIADSSRWAKTDPPFSRLADATVLRNRLYMIGLRSVRGGTSHALCINSAELQEVAGNFLERTYGAGIFLFGGKGSGQLKDAPLSRMLVYSNRVVDSLLDTNDWGGIETWQGGPAYVYNNISGNPGGYWNWAYRNKPNSPGVARLGFAYYLDGAFKNYHFNNIAWGRDNNPTSQNCNGTAFYEAVPTFHNMYFNNTVHKFARASQWSPVNGRHYFLGNLWLDISVQVFEHGKQKEDKEDDPSKPKAAEHPYETNAYANNIFTGTPVKGFGVFEAKGTLHNDAASFKKALEEKKSLNAELGVAVGSPPVEDADKHDFRPKKDSPAIDRGAKSFVPWGLYRMLGEWNFRCNNADPALLFDDHWYLAPYYVDRFDYAKPPMFHLKGVNITAESYVAGPLEDWTRGALKLNGRDQFATLSHGELSKPYTYEATVNKEKKSFTVAGRDLASPDIHTGNLLIEIYFCTEAGHSGSAIVSKLGGAGYQLALNKAGGVTLTLSAGGTKAELPCGALVNDGKWHHVIAEADRAAKRGTIYVDGVKAAEGALDLPPEASLSNSGDLFVGKDKDGRHFAGSIEFLRLAGGTLADARTTIEELYDWQFDGPFLRDFLGNDATGKSRDAGALEYSGK